MTTTIDNYKYKEGRVKKENERKWKNTKNVNKERQHAAWDVFLNSRSWLLRLTEEGQQHWVVVRHDKQVDAGEGGAGLEVAKRVSQLTLLATAADKHLHQQQDQAEWLDW